jgi:hypothetical protein
MSLNSTENEIKHLEELLKVNPANDLARLARIEKLLELYMPNKHKSDVGKRIKELKKERSKLNIIDYMYEIEIPSNLTNFIKWCDDCILEMWKYFEYEKLNATVLISYLCQSDNVISISKIEESVRNKSELKLPTLNDLCANPDILNNPTKFGFTDNNIDSNPDCFFDFFNISYVRIDGKKRLYHADESENKILQEILELFRMSYGLICTTLVKKILDDIKKKIHQFDIDRLLKKITIGLVKNKVIPKHRRETFGIIISYGFYENYITTSHMIPAQIEYLLLELLKSENENIYHTDPNTGIPRKDLILEELFGNSQYFEKLEKIFNKKSMDIKILHNLRYLFKYDNLRNDIYHGKCNDRFLKSATGMYLWLLFVKFLHALSFSK